MSEGAWIFMSHSHKDFDRVTPLRDELEKEGHHPLLFFLKCLNDDSEIDDLIRREIEARSWFILCDSSNSQASQWVQSEIEIIEGYPKNEKTYVKVNLDDTLSKQLDEVEDLTYRASVFLSYSHNDSRVATKVETALREQDFGVFSDLQLTPGSNWREEIESALKAAATKGAIVPLLSQPAIRSPYPLYELRHALEVVRASGRSSIVPVFIEPPAEVFEFAEPWLRGAIERIQSIDLSTNFDEGVQRLCSGLRNLDFRTE
jgi:hypothetical protein